jgi:hypothetical protein
MRLLVTEEEYRILRNIIMDFGLKEEYRKTTYDEAERMEKLFSITDTDYDDELDETVELIDVK